MFGHNVLIIVFFLIFFFDCFPLVVIFLVVRSEKQVTAKKIDISPWSHHRIMTFRKYSRRMLTFARKKDIQLLLKKIRV